MARKTLLHIKSNVVENGRPKLPQASQLLPGEIAVNYADGYETLSIKNSNDEIVTFTNDSTILAYIDEQDVEIANAAGLSIVESSGMTPSIENYAYVPDEDDYYLSAATSLYEADQIISQAVLDNERVTAEGLNDLNTRVNTVSGNVATVQTNLTNLSNSTNAAIADIYETIENLDAIDVDDTLTKTEVIIDDKTKYILGVKIDNALDLTSPYPVANSAVSTVIKEDEEVISAAFNDLNNKFASVSGDVMTVSGTISTLADTVDGISDDVEAISGDLQTKQNILTAGTGIDITDDVISCTLDTQISEFVQTLPASGLTSKLYFVPNEDTGATSGNTYVEYAWHQTGATEDQGEWEKLGEWEPSLTIDDELDLESTNPVENQAIASALTRIELVTAGALNDLNDSINELSGNVNTDLDRKENSPLVITVSTTGTSNIENLTVTNGVTYAQALSALSGNNQEVIVTGNYSGTTFTVRLDSILGGAVMLGSCNLPIPVVVPILPNASATYVVTIAWGPNNYFKLFLDDSLFSFETIEINGETQYAETSSSAVFVLDGSNISLGDGYTGDTSIISGTTIDDAFNQTAYAIGNHTHTLKGYTSPANNTDRDPLTSGDTITEAFEKVISAITDDERITSAALNSLNDDIEELSGNVVTGLDEKENKPLIVTVTGDSLPIDAYSALTITNGVTYAEALSAINEGREVIVSGNVFNVTVVMRIDGVANSTLVGDNMCNYNMMVPQLFYEYNISVRWDSSTGLSIGMFPTWFEVSFDVNNKTLSNDWNSSITLDGSDINLGEGYTGDTSIVSGATIDQAFNQVVAAIENVHPTLDGYETPANAIGTDPLSSGDTIVEAFEKVISAVTDNEEIVSSAINALHDELSDVETDVATLSGALEHISTMVEVTYSELVTLKGNSGLIPGSWYRITDYQCTTSQANTSAATHQFDVVVLALSENTLSEEARAMKHSGDTYFSGSTVNAWKIWYCLDNDTTRFAWADTTNGKGVIWRMIDEFNNDIKYDFKNILFQRTITNNGDYATGGTNSWCYTLNLWYDNACVDASIVGNVLGDREGYVLGVHDNVFGRTVNNDVLGFSATGVLRFVLGDNVVLTKVDGEYPGIFSNVIGHNFHHNTIGNYFHENTIGDGFYFNTIEYGLKGNTIGDGFMYNTIASSFEGNNIGNSFCHNIIGALFTRNMIGNYFRYNTIGNFFKHNTIGNDFFYNTTGTGTGSTATTKEFVRYICAEDGVQYVNITTTATTSASNYLQNIVISRGVSGTDNNNRKTITHPTVGDTFKTTYQPANSQVISV